MVLFANLKLTITMKTGRKHVIPYESYVFQRVLNDIDKAEDQLLDEDSFDLDDDF